MHHYVRLSYKVPTIIYRYHAMDRIEHFIYSQLDEFKCLPRDEMVIEFINDLYGKETETKDIYIMIRLTDEQAVKTAADRSEYKHPEPVKLDKKEKKKLRKMSKRKRSQSEDSEPVHKKLKECRCAICLEDMDTKKNITLECDCVFHYTCIKKWFRVKKTCPTCETPVKLN